MDKELDDVEEMEDMAEAGRGTDNVMAHLSLGEVVIPRAFLDDPQVMQALQQIFEAGGADMNQYTVGHEANSINPETGYPEFKFGKIFKRIASVALPIAGSFLGPVGAAAGGALGGALSGGGLKGALIGGALSGIGAGLSGAGAAASTGKGLLSGTALGNLNNSITGALSPIGSSISSGISGALKDFGSATGLSDLYTSASGALSNAAGGVSDQISNAYNGSVLQDGFKSGGDVLKSIGLNTSSDSLGTGVGASAGGGASSYSAPFDAVARPNTAFNTPFLDSLSATATEAAPQIAEAGANDMFSSQNLLSPIASVLLGSRANDKAEEQLLASQAANKALYEPYLNFQFNPQDLTTDPGYQFNLAQGNQALDRAQLARGGFFSGEALKDASKFATGLADNTFNTAFNRAINTNEAGLRGAGAVAGVNENMGNIRAGSTTNTGNLYSGALGSILGGNTFNNSGALMGGGGDFMSNYLRNLERQRMAA